MPFPFYKGNSVLPRYEGKDSTNHRQHRHVKTIMEGHKAKYPLLKYGSLKGLEESCPFQQETLAGFGTDME